MRRTFSYIHTSHNCAEEDVQYIVGWDSLNLYLLPWIDLRQKQKILIELGMRPYAAYQVHHVLCGLLEADHYIVLF